MTYEFLIREVGGAMVEREPTVGKWYAGAEVESSPEFPRFGILAEYVGEGCFCDEDSPENVVDMRGYQYLAEQVYP